MPYLGDLPQLLDSNLSQGVAYVEETETINFGDLEGPDMALERSAFAEALAGTGDKKSKAYKAARRNVERWVKGRRPMTISRRRIASARRQNSARLTAMRKVGAEMRVLVSAFSASRPGWLPPNGWVTIARDPMREVIHTWGEGDHELAAGQLFEQFLRRYGVPNPLDWMADSDVTDLKLRPRQGEAS